MAVEVLLFVAELVVAVGVSCGVPIGNVTGNMFELEYEEGVGGVAGSIEGLKSIGGPVLNSGEMGEDVGGNRESTTDSEKARMS